MFAFYRLFARFGLMQDCKVWRRRIARFGDELQVVKAWMDGRKLGLQALWTAALCRFDVMRLQGIVRCAWLLNGICGKLF